MAKIGKIVVDGTEIKTWEKSEIISTDVGIKNDVYSIETTIKNTFFCDLYSFDDFKMFCSTEERFKETYLNFVLFNESQVGYKLINIHGGLDISISRLSEKHFLIVGKNDGCPDVQGQVSFCELTGDGNVNEKVQNFSHLRDLFIISNKYTVVSMADEFDDGEKKKSFISSILVFNQKGQIVKTLLDKKTKTLPDISIETDDSSVSCFEKVDGKRTKFASWKTSELEQESSQNKGVEEFGTEKKLESTNIRKPAKNAKKISPETKVKKTKKVSEDKPAIIVDRPDENDQKRDIGHLPDKPKLPPKPPRPTKS